MVDEYNNNSRDDLDNRFSKLEAQVTDISHKMMILMVALERKLGPFEEFGSSKSEERRGSYNRYVVGCIPSFVG
jgi:hypothetical protein